MAAENQCSREIALPGGVREGKGGSIEWTHLRWACHVLFCNAMPWQCIARAFLARAVARALPKPWRAKALGAVAHSLDKTLCVSGLLLPRCLCRRVHGQGHAAAHCVTFGQSAAAGKGRSTFFTMGSEQMSRARALTRAFHRAMLARQIRATHRFLMLKQAVTLAKKSILF